MICIILTDFRAYDHTEAWHQRIFLNDPATGAHFPEGMVFHVLELPKIKEQDGTLLGAWMAFLKSKTMEQLMSVAPSSPAIKESVFTVKKMSGDELERAIAMSREMAELDIITAHSTGWQGGRQEEKFTIARNMLQDKTEHAVIAKWTGLSPGEINKLAAELGVS